MNIGKLSVDKIMELCEIRGEYNFQKCEELVKKLEVVTWDMMAQTRIYI